MKQSNLIILLVVVGIIIAILAFSMGPDDDTMRTNDAMVTDDVNSGLSDLDGDGIADEGALEDAVEADIQATTGADDVDVDIDGGYGTGAEMDVDIDDADVGTTLDNTNSGGVGTTGTTGTGTTYDSDTRL